MADTMLALLNVLEADSGVGATCDAPACGAPSTSRPPCACVPEMPASARTTEDSSYEIGKVEPFLVAEIKSRTIADHPREVLSVVLAVPVGLAFDGSPLPLMLGVLGFGLVNLLLMLVLPKGAAR